MTAITFRTNDAAKWGTGAGANLTPTQVDTNFWNLKQAVEALEASPPEAVSVDEIVQTGNSITFHLTNGTTQGPFTLPSAQITFRGDWAASTAYAVGDIVASGGDLYIVLTSHTSAATFDAGANNGSGADYYDLILAVSNPLPTGGTVGQVLTKLSSTNYDVAWVDAAGGAGSGSGGGGGGSIFDGASLTIGYTSSVEHLASIPFDEVSFASSADWYSVSDSVVSLRAAESCICEIGFQVELDPYDSSGRTLMFAVQKVTGTHYDNFPPAHKFYCATDTAHAHATSIIRVQAGATFALYFSSSDSSYCGVSGYSAGVWIRKLGPFPALIYPSI